jgi:hypothetical protein
MNAPGESDAARVLRRAEQRLARAASAALDASLRARLEKYDRKRALAGFHRLTPEIIDSETPAAARQVVAEIERAIRRERARCGHWTYDLNRHIALHVAQRAERARLSRLRARLPTTAPGA